MWFVLIATAVLAALIYKLFFSNPNKNFWKERGVYEIDTSSVARPFDVLSGRKGLYEADDYVYAKLGPSGKFCGIFEQGKPAVVIKDLDLIKKVLIKDFDHFVDRRQFFGESDGCLKQMLPNLVGDEWKGVRTSISPTFTTGKIRRMMNYFNEVGKEWVEELTRQAKENSGSLKIEPVSVVNQYTVDVIASTVFGMKAGTVKNPNSQFSVMANLLSRIGTIETIKFALRLQFPKLSQMLGIKVINESALNFFEALLAQGLNQRLSGAVKRNDFLQLLVEAKNGELKTIGSDELSTFEKEAMIDTSTGTKKAYLTTDIMNAQSMVFFFAGFSTTTNFITFAMYALALYPEVQDKLREEVRKIVKPDGSYDYDDLGQLVYLDMVVCEVLRKFSATARLERMCVKDYKDAETGLIVPKGTLVFVPLNSIHYDKRYYDNPDTFDPENFCPEKKNARNPYAFMPFGTGPRNCIGMRFALVEGKAAISHIVHNFRIEPTEKTPTTLQGKPAALMLMPPKGLELKLIPISN